jgi:hypothetical protein
MSVAKTTTERVAKLRAARDALGLKRLEVYAHPDDHKAIKTTARRLSKKRECHGAGFALSTGEPK